jgi:hypothetical protein
VLWAASVSLTIALVASDETTRATVSRSLVEAGIAIEVHDRAPPAAAFAVVWVVERGDEASAARVIGRWLAGRAARRAVVVTWRPDTVRAGLAAAADRVVLLVPPVFPWQIVDALRVRAAR